MSNFFLNLLWVCKFTFEKFLLLRVLIYTPYTANNTNVNRWKSDWSDILLQLSNLDSNTQQDAEIVAPLKSTARFELCRMKKVFLR